MTDPEPADPIAYLFSLETFGIKLGLRNIETICRAMGSPERAVPSIHVAGTNGKGSVTAMIAATLRHSGRRVARYTSPHLTRLEERFEIDGAPVDAGDLREVAQDVRQTVDQLLRCGALENHPTFFEATTACAFELFRRATVDASVIEVGLGGRFDATNVVSPAVTIITSIDFDHERHLGSTLSAIAFEKAGIIKTGAPLVTAEQNAEAFTVIADVCRSRGAPLVRVDDDTALASPVTFDSEGRARFDATTPVRRYGPLTLALRGRYQVRNALAAVRALETVRLPGDPIAASSIEHGLTAAVWPGRLDMRELADGRRALLDAAHNPAGAAALAEYLASLPEKPPLVFGAMHDKDYPAMLRALAPVVSRIIVTRPGTSRGAAVESVLDAARRAAPDLHVESAPDAADAIERAWTDARLVCVAGSIVLIGAVVPYLEARGARAR